MSNSSKNLTGKVAIVTGASSGVGRAISIALGASGAHVVCSDLREFPREDGFESDTRSTPELIRVDGGDALFHLTDVASYDSCRDLIKSTVAKYGRVDILVNNAGILQRGPKLHEISCVLTRYALLHLVGREEDWDRTISVNLKSVFNTVTHAIPEMLKNAIDGNGVRGKIINMASISGLIGRPNQAAYVASKGAVVSLTRALAVDYAPMNINVNCVCPGVIETSMMASALKNDEMNERLHQQTPWPTFAKPKDIADIVVYLVGAPGSICGASLVCDGGFSIL